MVTPASPKSSGRKITFRFVAVLNIIAALCFCHAAPLLAEEAEAEENNLRTAIIAGVLRYTYIPGEAESVLCTLGNIPYKVQLFSAAQHLKINQIPAKIKSITDLTNLQTCRVIVVGSSSSNEANKTSARNRTPSAKQLRNTLVICDNCDSNVWHADVTLIRNIDRIAFNINLKPDHEESIKFSANLLELAQQITRISP